MAQINRNARGRILVRLQVTSDDASVGLDAIALDGDTPVGDPIAGTNTPAHGLAVGANGSLWTADGSSWTQIAGGAGGLGPIPIGEVLGFGSEGDLRASIGVDLAGRFVYQTQGGSGTTGAILIQSADNTQAALTRVTIESGAVTTGLPQTGDIVLRAGGNPILANTGKVKIDTSILDMTDSTGVYPPYGVRYDQGAGTAEGVYVHLFNKTDALGETFTVSGLPSFGRFAITEIRIVALAVNAGNTTPLTISDGTTTFYSVANLDDGSLAAGDITTATALDNPGSLPLASGSDLVIEIGAGAYAGDSSYLVMVKGVLVV